MENTRIRRREEIRNAFSRLERRKRDGIRHIIQELRCKNVVDIVFVIDGTGSMDSYIRGVKDSIGNVVNAIKSKFSCLQFWFSIVVYQDFCDIGNERAPHIQTMHFTQNIGDFETYLGSIVATGGCNSGADVLGGLKEAKNMAFHTKSTRLVMHFGDAPCHGEQFHEPGYSDDHAEYKNEHDKSGVELARSILQNMKDAEIQYHFVRFNNSTDIMINKFHEISRDEIIGDEIIGDEIIGNEISRDESFPLVFNCPDVDIIAQILESSIYQSLGDSFASVNTSIINLIIPEAPRNPIPDPSEVISALCSSSSEYERLKRLSESDSWSDLPTYSTTMSSCVPVEVLDNLHYRPQFRQSDISMKIKFKPLGEGANRIAYLARDETNGKVVVKVIKEREVTEGVSIDEYVIKSIEEEVFGHAAASYFAQKYNENRPRGTRSIRFIPAHMIFVQGSSSRRIVMTCEDKIEGEYKKWTTNAHPLIISPEADELCAFSHFTYTESAGYMIVTDLQGVMTTTEFILTNPAILCADELRFGSTNLGMEGMQYFLEHHTCGDHCLGMGIECLSL